MFVTRGFKNSLFFVFDSLSNLDCGQWYSLWIYQSHFRKVTSVSIHYFIEWLDTFFYVLRPANMTVKEVNHIRCFAIDIAKDLMLLSCRLSMERLCVLQLETACATLVTAWYTLADRRCRSKYRSSDQCILNAFRSSERYTGGIGNNLASVPPFSISFEW